MNWRVSALLFVLSGIHFTLRAEIMYWPLPLDLAVQKARSIDCASNLREISVATQIWIGDNNNQFPTNLLSLTNEFESSDSSVLFCPANFSHQAVTNWDNVNWNQIDYEWVPQTNWAQTPNNIFCKCYIHNQALLVDGTVLPVDGYRAGWPGINASPANTYVTPSNPAQFQVKITSTALLPLNYQWRREHPFYITNIVFISDTNYPGGGFWTTNVKGDFTIMAIVDATNSTYTIQSPSTNDSDYYSVAISNSIGTTISGRAQLKVDASVAAMATNSYWSAVHCINNLKGIALCETLWEDVHNGASPQSLAEMTNYFGYPMVGWPFAFYCRSDTQRSAPLDWSGVNLTNVSYEVVPHPNYSVDPTPFCRCKVHGFYSQMDGAVIASTNSPIIFLQPTNQTVTLSTPATFSVSVMGLVPMSLQWQKNGSNIPSATNSILLFSNVQATNTGNYTVIATNAAGSVTSSAATLAVISGYPIISQQPVGQTIVAGSAVSFSVVVSGTSPFSFQWRRGTSNLLGMTNAILSLSSVALNQAGSYSVIVSNSFGTVTSQSAILGVESPYNKTRQAVPGLIRVENYDEGGEGVAYHDTTATNLFGLYRNEGVDIATDPAGGYVVGWTEPGEWENYSIHVNKATNYVIAPLIASDTNVGVFHLEINGVDKTGPFYVPNTGGWTTYQLLAKTNIFLTAGDHVMKVVVDTGQFNIGEIILTDFASVRPQFDFIRKVNTQIQLRFLTAPNQTNSLEATTDFLTWTNLQSFSPSNAVVLFSEPTNVLKRFYRLRAR